MIFANSFDVIRLVNAMDKRRINHSNLKAITFNCPRKRNLQKRIKK